MLKPVWLHLDIHIHMKQLLSHDVYKESPDG